MKKNMKQLVFVALLIGMNEGTKAQEPKEDGFVLRCEALVGEGPEKLVIEQEYAFYGKTGKEMSVTLHAYAADGSGLAAQNLNQNREPAREHYLRTEAEKVVIANLRAVNDGLEEIATVEYSATNKDKNRLRAVRYLTESGREVIEAIGTDVECSLEKIQ